VAWISIISPRQLHYSDVTSSSHSILGRPYEGRRSRSELVSSMIVVWRKYNTYTIFDSVANKHADNDWCCLQDVYRYLKGLGQQLMIWKCRNAIQTFWHHEPLPYIGQYWALLCTMRSRDALKSSPRWPQRANKKAQLLPGKTRYSLYSSFAVLIFKVIQGQWFLCNLKGRMSLFISD